jgi:hypothetical protein
MLMIIPRAIFAPCKSVQIRTNPACNLPKPFEITKNHVAASKKHRPNKMARYLAVPGHSITGSLG